MKPYYTDESVTLYHGDALATLRTFTSGSVDCVVTSPPYYGLRDYGVEGQYGLEASPAEYVETMRAVFSEARRALANDGTLWLNLGDSYVRAQEGNVSQTKQADKKVVYPQHSKVGSHDGLLGRADRPGTRAAGLSVKNLLGIPWRVAFALQDDGWTLRNAIVWHKPNAMPESVTDRVSSRYEPLFLFSKSRRYWFDLDAVREPLAWVPPRSDSPRQTGTDATPYPAGMRPQTNRGPTGSRHRPANLDGRNPGDVWTIPTSPFAAAHFACMPPALAERCVKAGCKPGGVVLDPFSGSGTTGLAATKLGRRYVGIDLSSDYLDLSLQTRLAQSALIDGGAA